MTTEFRLADIPYPLVQVKARDWGLTADQWRVDSRWYSVVGYISGWLINESGSHISIGQQLFYEDGDAAHWETRYTITIPKETILERIDVPPSSGG
jgi:hypothetical protein